MIRIDADLLSERTSLGQLHGNEAKIAAGSRLLTKLQPREHRTHTPSNRIRPCGELMLPEAFGSTTIDCCARIEEANTKGTADATGGVAIGPSSAPRPLLHMQLLKLFARRRRRRSCHRLWKV